ncbi:hypothetical protein HYQ46_010781 [Verticillium longisporum]|nr:hypothetical protein HYQ46_010781 [Verticillium longisporum]
MSNKVGTGSGACSPSASRASVDSSTVATICVFGRSAVNTPRPREPRLQTMAPIWLMPRRAAMKKMAGLPPRPSTFLNSGLESWGRAM